MLRQTCAFSLHSEVFRPVLSVILVRNAECADGFSVAKGGVVPTTPIRSKSKIFYSVGPWPLSVVLRILLASIMTGLPRLSAWNLATSCNFFEGFSIPNGNVRPVSQGSVRAGQ